MPDQDIFYLEKESDAYFDRWKENNGSTENKTLRAPKIEILNQLKDRLDLKNLKVLEIGCFIGDLLATLKSEYTCTVHGVESSSKACAHAKRFFKIDVEHSTFAKSHFFSLSPENQYLFDLIICDDVLSWMSRDLILPSMGVLDWLLKPGGSIFLRDFSPAYGFAYENHHWPGQDIYNFKQPGGHRQFFLQTGKYLERSTHVRTDDQYQKVTTSRPDSLVWADSILTKIRGNLHPIEKLS